MIGLRLEKDVLAKVKAQAKKEDRKLGPMVAVIIKRYFDNLEVAKNAPTAQ